MMTVRQGVTVYLGDLQRFARSLAGPQRSSDVEDLVQDCIVRAIEKTEQYREGTNLRAWLFSIMRSNFISGRRHAMVCRRHAERVGRGPAPVAQPVQVMHVMLRHTARALRSLPGADIRNIRELGIAEQPLNVAASMGGVPVGTLKSRLSRSRARLRQVMGMEGELSVGHGLA